MFFVIGLCFHNLVFMLIVRIILILPTCVFSYLSTLFVSKHDKNLNHVRYHVVAHIKANCWNSSQGLSLIYIL